MDRYPILFRCRELVEGNGFIAGVGINGRALLFEEDGDMWVEGILLGGRRSRSTAPT